MMQKYKLDENKHPVPVDDVLEWAKQYEGKDRVVEQTEYDTWLAKLLRPVVHLFGFSIVKVRVSTVFLGIDHAFTDQPHKPILFETMVFNGTHDGLTRRCSTWNEAVEQHRKVCARVRKMS